MPFNQTEATAPNLRKKRYVIRLVRDATSLRTLIAQPPDLASGYVSAYLLDTPPGAGTYTYRTEFRVVSGGTVRAQTGGDFSSSMRAMELAPA